MTSLELTISEEDLEALQRDNEENPQLLVLGNDENDQLNRDQDKSRKAVDELVPKLLTKKLNNIIPDDYKLLQVKLDVKIKGKLMGQELSGNVQVTFGPNE